MRYLFYLVFTVLIIGFSFGFFRAWSLGGFAPDLMLLFTISLALAYKNFDYLFVGVIGGIWMDVLYGLPIGSFSMVYVLAGALSSVTFEKWLFSVGGIKWQHFLLVVILASLLSIAWIWLFTNILYARHLSPVALSGPQVLKSGGWTVFANLLFAYPVYMLVEFFVQYTLRFKKNQLKF